MKSSFELRGCVAFVTGGAGHLGQALTRALAGAGARVYVGGRDSARVKALCDELSSAALTAFPACFDLADADELRNFCTRTLAAEGRLDVLVNNAYAGVAGSLETIEPDQYAEAFQVAVTAAGQAVRHCLPLLEAAARVRGQASIVNIASMYGTVSPDPRVYVDGNQRSPPHYGAAKAALIQFTRYLACHLAQKNIRVNAISPGPFPQPAVGRASPGFVEQLEHRVPLGRLGQPDELAGPLLFLASSASSYVTGINLPVDGGWTAW